MSRALVVDDDVEVLRLVEDIFRSRGWDVAGTASTAAARERLSRTGYDVVVIDLTMPGEGGLSLAEHAASRGLPVLVMSGDAERLSAMPPPRFQVLRKPFRVDDFMRTVEAVMNTD